MFPLPPSRVAAEIRICRSECECARSSREHSQRMAYQQKKHCLRPTAVYVEMEAISQIADARAKTKVVFLLVACIDWAMFLRRATNMNWFQPHSSHRYYCSKCHSEIGDSEVRRSFDFVRLESWCGECREAVDVTSCKVPYLTVTSVLAIGFLAMT